MQRIIIIYLILISFCSCSSNVSESEKKFPPISLLNKIEFFEPGKDWDKLGSGFLLKYREDTFVVSAKHIIAIAKTDSMTYLTIDKYIKKWSLFPLNKESESVIIDRLLNENKTEKLLSKNRFVDDWLLFSIKENNSRVKPVEFRETPLISGEKLYIVGWTRHMTGGEQRVYEYTYYKTKGTHLLLKKVHVPEKTGGLSGCPVLDENGLLVGIVSNSTFEITALRKFFSPCKVDNLKNFLDNYIDNK